MLSRLRARIPGFAKFAVVLVSSGIVATAIVLAVGSDEFEILSEVQYVPYPFFLVPALAALALSLVLGRGWRIVAGFALGLCLTFVMGLKFNFGEQGALRVRVMTFNVKGYITLKDPQGALRIATEVARHDADVLVLQDAGSLVSLEERSPGALRATFGGRQVFSQGEYVIASRFRFRECEGRPVAVRKGHYEHVRCVLVAHGVEVDLMTAHFTSPRWALGSVREGKADALEAWRDNLLERNSQAEAVAREVRARRRPVIFAGDLNAPERSLVIGTLVDAGLRDAFSIAGKGYGYTYGHSLRPGISFLRIDHVLVSPEIAVSDCFVGGSETSPHRPVIADLYLARGRS